MFFSKFIVWVYPPFSQSHPATARPLNYAQEGQT